MSRPHDASRPLAADALRAGYRYLHWAASYRPRFCARLRPGIVRDRRRLADRLRRLQALGFELIEVGPLVDRATARIGARLMALERLLAATAALRLAVVVVVFARPDAAVHRRHAGAPAARSAARRVLRAVARVLAPHRHRVIVQLVADPRADAGAARSSRATPARGVRLAGALEASHGFEAWVEERVADLQRALRRGATSAGEREPSLLATVGRAPMRAPDAPQQRLVYRATGATTAGVGTARAATAAALASVVHDRPCLATALTPGGPPLALALLLGQGLVTAWRPGRDVPRLARFIRRIGTQWTDPAQEPVAVLIAEGAILDGDARARAALERAVWVVHARLRLAARTASELDPLALDKQPLIVVPSPQRLTDQGWSLLRHQMARGKTVLLTGPAERNVAGRVVPRLAALGCTTELAPVRAAEALTLGAEPFRLRFVPHGRRGAERLTMRGSTADGAALHEIPVGQGRLILCPLPIELATAAADPAIARIYRLAAARAGLVAADAPLHDGRRFWREIHLGHGTLTGLVGRHHWRLWFTRADGTVVHA